MFGCQVNTTLARQRQVIRTATPTVIEVILQTDPVQPRKVETRHLERRHAVFVAAWLRGTFLYRLVFFWYLFFFGIFRLFLFAHVTKKEIENTTHT